MEIPNVLNDGIGKNIVVRLRRKWHSTRVTLNKFSMAMLTLNQVQRGHTGKEAVERRKLTGNANPATDIEHGIFRQWLKRIEKEIYLLLTQGVMNWQNYAPNQLGECIHQSA